MSWKTLKRQLVIEWLFSILSCLLAVNDIKPAVDGQGTIIELNLEFTSGILS